ncbi:MAG: Holliday junction resolvase RuvX [Candidatus Bipolaricaulota bacterium]|nr:Holliday junction resolvase RuvX [Candidatus Bipolaricaulota bacterium]
MRVLGIDYGRVRVGLALSDEEGILASPLPALARSRRDVDDIAWLAQEREVGCIVVGLPLLMNGTDGTMAEEARAFATRIADRTHLPVDLLDERWTSSEAERVMLEGNLSRERRKELRDGLAAVLILQAYLARRRADPDLRPLGGPV